jgi:hypothetical protein
MHFIRASVALVLALSMASFVLAADESGFWNVESGDFGVGSNWSGGVVPNGAGIGTIGTTGGTGVGAGTATLTTTESMTGLTVGFGGAGGLGTLIVDGGTLTAGAGTFGIGGGGGGTLDIRSGAATFNGATYFGRGSGTAQGNGTLLLSDGTLTITADVSFGGLTSTSNASTGNVIQSGGTFNFGNGAGSNMRVGLGKSTSGVAGLGTYELQDGTLNISTNSVGIILGDGSNTLGRFIMSGGTLTIPNKGMDLGRDNGTGIAEFSGGHAAVQLIGVGGNYIQNAGPGNGTGTMTVRGTADLTVGTMVVGTQGSNNNANTTSFVSNGSLLIQGGALTMTDLLAVGVGTSTITNPGTKIGNGTLVVSNGVLTTPILTLGQANYANSYARIEGGTANVGSLLSGGGTGITSAFDFTGGTLHVDESAIDVTNNGGTLSPGGSGDVGTTSFVDKNYTQNSGTLWIDLSAGTFDTVTTGAGTASIAGTIHVNTADTLIEGQTFDVLVASLASLDPATLVTGTDAVGHSFSASIVNSNSTLELRVEAVPEPAAISTGILASAWLLKRRARRRIPGLHRS